MRDTFAAGEHPQLPRTAAQKAQFAIACRNRLGALVAAEDYKADETKEQRQTRRLSERRGYENSTAQIKKIAAELEAKQREMSKMRDGRPTYLLCRAYDKYTAEIEKLAAELAAEQRIISKMRPGRPNDNDFQPYVPPEQAPSSPTHAPSSPTHANASTCVRVGRPIAAESEPGTQPKVKHVRMMAFDPRTGQRVVALQEQRVDLPITASTELTVWLRIGDSKPYFAEVMRTMNCGTCRRQTFMHDGASASKDPLCNTCLRTRNQIVVLFTGPRGYGVFATISGRKDEPEPHLDDAGMRFWPSSQRKLVFTEHALVCEMGGRLDTSTNMLARYSVDQTACPTTGALDCGLGSYIGTPYSVGIEAGYELDGTVCRSAGYYINAVHPVSGPKPNVKMYRGDKQRVWIEALCDIYDGEELLLEYGW